MNAHIEITGRYSSSFRGINKQVDAQMAGVIKPSETELKQARNRLLFIQAAAEKISHMSYERVASLGKKYSSPILHFDLGINCPSSPWNVQKLGIDWGEGDLRRVSPKDKPIVFSAEEKPLTAASSIRPRMIGANDFCLMIESTEAFGALKTRDKFKRYPAYIMALPVKDGISLDRFEDNSESKMRLVLTISKFPKEPVRFIPHKRERDWRLRFVTAPVVEIDKTQRMSLFAFLKRHLGRHAPVVQ